MSGFTGKCSGTKKDGSPCTQPPRGNGFCRFHGGARVVEAPQASAGILAQDDTGLTVEIALLRKFIRDQIPKDGTISDKQIVKVRTTMDRLTKAVAAQQRYEQLTRQVMTASDMATFLTNLIEAIVSAITDIALLDRLIARVGEVFNLNCPSQWPNLPQQVFDETTSPPTASVPSRTTVIHEDAIPPLPKSAKPQNLGVRH
jgi:Family of unknown function (DUF5763)